MQNHSIRRKVKQYCLVLSFVFTFILISASAVFCQTNPGEVLYKKFSELSRTKGDITLFQLINEQARDLDWDKASEETFTGNLRLIHAAEQKGPLEKKKLYLLRELEGKIYILMLPKDTAQLEPDADSFYAGIDDMLQSRMIFNIKVQETIIGGESYTFARFIAQPFQGKLDKIFRISIVLMLFFVMIGMGMTLTVKDFTLVFQKPKGIIIGEILQFGLMPSIALLIGHVLGFYEHYPFIFVGMILVTTIPGGVTSNLMTYYAKGDLALSISMTSFSTVLSLFFTPLLLGLYCANVPEVAIPVKTIVGTIIILVIVPLFIGMIVRGKWEKFATKATPFFSLLGIISLLFIMIFGVLSNLHVFTDVNRYGVKFYSMVFSLTMLGMIFGALIPKIFGINNYQIRAISLESGLRNVSLAMAIAILIQDIMGDFHSSMFVVSGIFGLMMYIAGLFSIFLFKKIFPVDDPDFFSDSDKPGLAIDSSDEA